MTVGSRSALSRLLSALMLAASLVGSQARAGADTYCVGGLGACSTSAVTQMHGQWHFHTWLTDGHQCFECYDEVDNTCVTDFVLRHPDWRAIPDVVCQVRHMVAPPSEGVREHRVSGDLVATPSGAQHPVRLDVHLTTPAGGPFAPGEAITFEARLADGTGNPRGFQSAMLVLEDQSGTEVARSVMQGGNDGLARIDVTVPNDAHLRGRVEIQNAYLQPGEQLAGIDGQALSLAVGGCALRTALDPGLDEVIPSGTEIVLRGRLVDPRGQASLATPKVAAATVFTLRLDDGEQAIAPARDEDGAVVARLRVPLIRADVVPATVTLAASPGSSGGASICTGGSRRVRVARLGLAIQPEPRGPCYVGKPCEVGFSVQLAKDATARRQAEAFLDAPELRVTLASDRDELPAHLDRARLRVASTWTPTVVGAANLRVTLTAGNRAASAAAAVEIRDPIVLRLPAALDLGTLSSAHPSHAPCADLEFSASSGLVGAPFSIRAEPQPQPGPGRLHTIVAGGGYDLEAGEADPFRITFGGETSVPVCVALPRCARAPTRIERTVVVQSLVPEFASERASVRISYALEPLSFWSCWRNLLVAGGAVSFLAFVGVGFTRAVSFPVGTTIRLARDRGRLARASRRELRSSPGGRARWYATARLHFDGSGNLVPSARRALFTLKPDGGGVVLETRALVSREDRRTRKMVPVDAAKDGLALDPGSTYAVGDLFVAIE